MYEAAYRVADICLSVGYRGKPSKKPFSPSGNEIDVAGLRTPGADLSARFDVDRYFFDGCRDVVEIEIADETVRNAMR